MKKKLTTEKIILLGDHHGEWNRVFYDIKRLDIKNCILIQVGDGGEGFTSIDKQMAQFNIFNEKFKERNIQYLAIRGNHSNPIYFDGRVQLSNLKLLSDYTYLKINGETFLFVGGAISIDRILRVPNVSWWEDERFVLKPDLVKKVDVLITHSAPYWIGPFDKSGIDYYCQKDSLLWGECVQERKDITELLKLAKPSRSYHGHFHITAQVDFDGCLARILNIHEMIEHFPCKK
jgi:hypothetical protein